VVNVPFLRGGSGAAQLDRWANMKSVNKSRQALWAALAIFPLAAQPCGEVGVLEQLPPLELSPAHIALAEGANAVPRTAVDFYLLLPPDFFGGLDDSPNRRLWYLDLTALTDDYLKAEFHFECDGGGFGIEMRVYPSPAGPVVGVETGRMETVYDDGDPKDGDPEIAVKIPAFYRLRGRSWLRLEDGILPKVDIQNVLARYYGTYRTDRHYRAGDKQIWLKYEMLPSSTNIELEGRENFMDPYIRYVWAKYRWTGQAFVSVPDLER
jgi:hypothetical protein